MDVIAILTALNPVAFPNDAGHGDEVTHPVMAYEKQSACLRLFEEPVQRDSCTAMVPLLPEALHLYDVIRSTAVDVYNSERRKGHFVKNADRRYGRGGPYRLSAGAFATLAAFRVFVRRTGTKSNMRWECGFDGVLEAWERLGEGPYGAVSIRAPRATPRR